ncbi:5'-3' exonuclease PLD3-like isoform X1 [Lampetra fluviatilis]
MKEEIMYELCDHKMYMHVPCNTRRQRKKKEKRWLMTFLLVVGLLLVGAFLLLPLFWDSESQGQSESEGVIAVCEDSCSASLMESVPDGMAYGPNASMLQPLHPGWTRLARSAQRTLQVASFFWTLTASDLGLNESSAQEGKDLLDLLLSLPSKGVAVSAVSSNSIVSESTDFANLTAAGAQTRVVDMYRLTGGVMHSKIWVVDRKHIFIGSPNMDWRAITQVKELGIAIYNCSCLGEDLAKVFEVYWLLGRPNATIPAHWPANLSTSINKEKPLQVRLSGTPTEIYISSSPPSLCATGRTSDLDAILSVIDSARTFVHIAIMNYFPIKEFHTLPRYWPAIDESLRRAAYERRVHVKLLVGCWHYTRTSMFIFLRSLQALSDNSTGCDVEVKVFKIPVDEHQKSIPATRIYHHKFMVTENTAYIGTSNWAEDYFIDTAGVGLVMNETKAKLGTTQGPDRGTSGTVRDQLEAVFSRDWDSEYAHKLTSRWAMQNICR